MKYLKKVFVFFFCFMVFLCTSVYAGVPGWIYGTITQVGSHTSGGWIQFTANDGSFTQRSFAISPSNTSSLLAIALTAQSLGVKSWIYVEDPDTPGSICTQVASVTN